MDLMRSLALVTSLVIALTTTPAAFAAPAGTCASSTASRSGTEVQCFTCTDNAQWTLSVQGGIRNCAWFAANDPGCTIYPDFGQKAACLTTCQQCTSNNPAASQATTTLTTNQTAWSADTSGAGTIARPPGRPSLSAW